MKLRIQFLPIVLLSALGGLLISACGGDDPTATPVPRATATPTPAPTGNIPRNPALLALIDEAKAEGGVLEVLGGSIDEPGSLKEWSAGMTKEFGFDFKITFTEGGNMSQVASQTAEEFLAGRPSSTDLFIGTAPSISALTNADAVEIVDWLGLAPWLPEGSVAPDGRSLAKSTQIKGIWYNTDLVKGSDIPVRTTDILNPKWKGLISTTPYVAGFREAGGYFDRLDEMVQLLTDFRESGNLAGFMRCGEGERIASGEFAMFAFACSNGSLRELQAKGAPVDYVVPEDLAIITYVHIAVPKLSPHPALAKLFSIYWLTPEAQAINWKYYLDDLHLVEGSRSAAEIAKKAPPGVELQVVTPAMVAQFTEEFAEANKVLRKASTGE